MSVYVSLLTVLQRYNVLIFNTVHKSVSHVSLFCVFL